MSLVRICARAALPKSASVRFLSTYYSKDHEWVSVKGGVATVGITNYAAKALGDVVYVGLPDVGASFASG